MTNTISFLFSFFGTRAIISGFGFGLTLLAYPALLLICTGFVWAFPNIWVNNYSDYSCCRKYASVSEILIDIFNIVDGVCSDDGDKRNELCTQ